MIKTKQALDTFCGDAIKFSEKWRDNISTLYFVHNLPIEMVLEHGINPINKYKDEDVFYIVSNYNFMDIVFTLLSVDYKQVSHD
jgi:hypothetical protein